MWLSQCWWQGFDEPTARICSDTGAFAQTWVETHGSDHHRPDPAPLSEPSGCPGPMCHSCEHHGAVDAFIPTTNMALPVPFCTTGGARITPHPGLGAHPCPPFFVEQVRKDLLFRDSSIILRGHAPLFQSKASSLPSNQTP